MKHGPYNKHKTQSGGSSDGTTFASFPQQMGNSNAVGQEWQSSQPDAAPSTMTMTPAAVNALVQFTPGPPPPGPEGYYL